MELSILEQYKPLAKHVLLLWGDSSESEDSKADFEEYAFDACEEIGDDDLCEELEFLAELNHKR